MVARTSEEELEVIQNWWSQYGKQALTGVLVVLIMVFGWQGWKKYQASQSEKASFLYQSLVEEVLEHDKPNPAKVSEIAKKLSDDFPGTYYEQYARLMVAKVAVDLNKLDDAAKELKTVIKSPADDTLKTLASQRLARVLLAQNKAKQALAVLKPKAPKDYATLQNELRGDVLLKLNKVDEARKMYIKAQSETAAPRAGLQMKIDNLAQKRDV